MKRSERLENDHSGSFNFRGEAPVSHLDSKDSAASFDRDIQEVRAMQAALTQRILWPQIPAAAGALFVHELERARYVPKICEIT
jgi:hypothetical protein